MSEATFADVMAHVFVKKCSFEVLSREASELKNKSLSYQIKLGKII